MFGFVVTNNEELTQEEKDRYQEAYCGLCHALGKRCGQQTRMALNHDLTFLALLLMSLYEPEETKFQTRCVMHPMKKHVWTSNKYIDYAADMTVALTYHKCTDDWNDDHSVSARAFALVLQKRYREVAAKWPRQCAALEAGMSAIAEVERDDNDNPDAAANLFGQIMGEMFVMEPDIWENPLRMMGAQLGRFIYMMDAAVDLEKDQAKGSYNPFALREWTDEELHTLLLMYMGNVTEIFEKLPLVEDINLLRNVLYSGVWVKYNHYMKKKLEKQEGKQVHTDNEEASPEPVLLEDPEEEATPVLSDVCPEERPPHLNATLEFTAPPRKELAEPLDDTKPFGALA